MEQKKADDTSRDLEGAAAPDKEPTFIVEALKKFAKVGRPPAAVDEHDVELLASCLLPKTEVARRLGISVDTLNRRFLDAYLRGKDAAKFYLRTKQLSTALAGNIRMLQWLGVQELGQRHQLDLTNPKSPDDGFDERAPEELTREELEAIASRGFVERKRGGGLDAKKGGEGDPPSGRRDPESDRLH